MVPFLKSKISMTESAQKHFTKKICYHCNISNTSYSHCQNMQNLKSLKHKRIERDLKFMYKIIHGDVDLKFRDFFQFAIVDTICINMVLQLSH